MTLSAVATRYAKALADVTTSAAGLRPEEALSQLRAFEAALAASHELQNALTTPAVPASRKRAVVGTYRRHPQALRSSHAIFSLS